MRRVQTILKDQPYGHHPRQQLDVYGPVASGPSRPVVVFFYGGSWKGGRRRQYRRFAQTLAAMGYVVAVPDYRVYPEVQFPAFVEDGAAAVSWVFQHAAELGADPQRIALVGHSAGAHIAACLSFDQHYLPANVRPGLKAFVGLSGPYDFSPRQDIVPIFAGQDPERWNPARQVRPGAPASLLIHGRRDTIVEPANSENLASKLSGAGSRVTLVILPHIGHYLTLIFLAVRSSKVRRAVRGFLKAQLGA